MKTYDGSPLGSRPLLRWGFEQAIITALRNNADALGSSYGVSQIYVGRESPREEARYPAIVIRGGSVTIEAEGMGGYLPSQAPALEMAVRMLSDDEIAALPEGTQRELTQSSLAHIMYSMRGTLSLEVLARSASEATRVSDFLTRMYFERLLHEASFYNTASYDVEMVAPGLAPGSISWSDLQGAPPPWNTGSTTEQLFQSTGSIEFQSEHFVAFDFLRVSGLSLEALPVHRLADGPGGNLSDGFMLR